jgi:hypothetical protein
MTLKTGLRTRWEKGETRGNSGCSENVALLRSSSSQISPTGSKFPIVGIGASAGGFDRYI